MQADAVAHDLRLDDESLQCLHDAEYCQHQQRMFPITELHEGDDERQKQVAMAPRNGIIASTVAIAPRSTA
jgi:hypothetical protein